MSLRSSKIATIFVRRICGRHQEHWSEKHVGPTLKNGEKNTDLEDPTLY